MGRDPSSGFDNDEQSMENPTSQFLQDWHQGDPKGLESLLERHLPWIQSFVHKRLSDLLRRKAETGDIVQDAVVQFLRYGPRFHLSDERQFRGLLCRIVENVLRDKYDWFTAKRRSIAAERPLPADTVLNLDPPHGGVETPSQIVQQHEQEAWVRLGLELLEPESRQIIILREWEELSFTEVGRKIGTSRDTARRRYMEAIFQLMNKVRELRSGELDRALKMT
jgi:RNA polymerase sigma-70 factor (ECF subfamily)